MNHAKEYFDNHEVDKLFFTSDGLAFFDQQNAVNHAGSLEDETVAAMTRDEADAAAAGLAGIVWEDDEDYDPLDEYDAE